jgi:hypothetical protein
MAPRDIDGKDEWGRERSRSQHRDRSRERSRRRDGESDKDRYRRRRDRYRRDTIGRGDEDEADLVVPSGDQSHPMNALGIQPLHPGQGLYAPLAPPVTSISANDRIQELYPSASRATGASSSYSATSYGNAPAMANSVSVPGMRHREVPQTYGTGTSRATRADPIYRPSSTPSETVLSTWVAPDLSNPSMNSLGLSAPRQDANGANSQTQPTARDSVSSWGTADSGPTHGDLFSTLRPLASAPAETGLSSSELLPRSDGQLLGVVRTHSTPTPAPFLATYCSLCFTGPLCANCESATTVSAGSNAVNPRYSPGPRRRQSPALPSLQPRAPPFTNVARLHPRSLPNLGITILHT